jgi:biopolymer transport protein ExbD
MSWKIRHEGSPQAVEVPSPGQIVEGLQDGHWEPTDEVMGPEDRGWVPIENHPVLAEAASEVEPPPPHEHEDESHIDMNALIDVCMVLLVFFILTTTYAALQKRMDAAAVSEKKPSIKTVKKKDADTSMVRVSAKMENGQPVIKVQDQVVSPERLGAALSAAVGPGRNTLLLQHDEEVPHGMVVQIQDEARRAGLDKVYVVVEEIKPAKAR